MQESLSGITHSHPPPLPENPGYVLRLSAAEWQEHQDNAMFAGLKISYTMDEGVYVIRLTDEQYEEYKKNQGEWDDVNRGSRRHRLFV